MFRLFIRPFSTLSIPLLSVIVLLFHPYSNVDSAFTLFCWISLGKLIEAGYASTEVHVILPEDEYRWPFINRGFLSATDVFCQAMNENYGGESFRLELPGFALDACHAETAGIAHYSRQVGHRQKWVIQSAFINVSLTLGPSLCRTLWAESHDADVLFVRAKFNNS